MRIRGDEGGSALVEFAVFLSLLAPVLAGIVDYGLELQQAMQVADAAAAGAAYGAMPGNAKSFSGMQSAASNAASGVNGFTVSAADVFTCTPGGAVASSATVCSGYGTPIEYVQVQTSATVPSYLAYAGMPANLVLRGSAMFRVPWTP
jgi:Flp pilus assembly protein TadG